MAPRRDTGSRTQPRASRHRATREEGAPSHFGHAKRRQPTRTRGQPKHSASPRRDHTTLLRALPPTSRAPDRPAPTASRRSPPRTTPLHHLRRHHPARRRLVRRSPPPARLGFSTARPQRNPKSLSSAAHPRWCSPLHPSPTSPAPLALPPSKSILTQRTPTAS